MPYTDAQRKARRKYQSAHQKTLACPVNLDEYARFKSYAEQNGKTISGVLLEYVRKCITEPERMEQTEQRVQPYHTPPRTVYTLNGQEFLGRRALQDYLRSINVNVTDSVINNYITEGRIGAATLAKYPILAEIRRKETDTPTNTEQKNGTD